MRKSSDPLALENNTDIDMKEPLRECDGETEPGLEHAVGVVHVVAVVSVPLLHPEAGEGLEPDVRQPVRLARCPQSLIPAPTAALRSRTTEPIGKAGSHTLVCVRNPRGCSAGVGGVRGGGEYTCTACSTGTNSS